MTENKYTTDWSDWANDEGVVQYVVDYNTDVLSGFLEANDDSGHCKLAASLIDGFELPEAADAAQKIASELRSASTGLTVRANALEDGAESSALFRQATRINEAASFFYVSHDFVGFIQQTHGDEDLANMLEIVDAWDREFEGRTFSETEGEFASARSAYETSLHSGSGFSEAILTASESALTISFNGYGCSMRDVELRVVDAARAAFAQQFNDDEEGVLSLIEAMSDEKFELMSEAYEQYADAATHYWFSMEFSWMSDQLLALPRVDIQRVVEAMIVLADEWTGDFDELVAAALALTVEKVGA
jgi:hypothetical protein